MIEKLQKIFINAEFLDLQEFDAVWRQFQHDFGVTERKHEDMILATLLSEVGNSLENRRENLNYTPEALRNTFSRYSNNPNWSERDGRTEEHSANQINIGNIAYADRLGNGDIDSGDGYKFRGGGYIQLTGRSNWEQSSSTIQMLTGEVVDAEYLERECGTVTFGILMTFSFMFDNNLTECDDMDCCTDKVNYHTSSREQRNSDYEWISNL